MRIAHGTLMASAFALVFPLGAILLRMLPVSRRPVRAHYALQMLGYAMVLGGMGLGLWLGLEVRYLDYAHTVVGFVVVSLVGVQALLGALGHRRVLGREKEGLGSGIWQTGVHRWLGRVVLVAGVVNGGLGLALADNTTGGRVAYGVVAGVMGLLCLSLTGWKVHLRHRAANRRRLTIF